MNALSLIWQTSQLPRHLPDFQTDWKPLNKKADSRFAPSQWETCNIGYPTETHFKLKYREISFAYNLFISQPIVLNDTTVLCAKYQSDGTTQKYVMDERDFTRFDFNILRPRQNGRNFADDMLKCIFLNANVWIPIEISLKFVPNGSINNNPALFQIMAWRRPGDKPLSGPMVVSLPTHICVTRPQWVKMSSGYPILHTTQLNWSLYLCT